MALLLLGLVVFLGVHAISMMRTARAGLIDRLGPAGYKAAYSVVSVVGFALIVIGFARYRAAGYIPVWSPPAFMTHLTMLLMLPAMIALGAFMAPAGRIKAVLKHPMLVAIKLWALAHLLANGDLGSLVLFGSFLAYGVIDRISVKRRGGGEPPVVQRSWGSGDAIALVLGLILYFSFVYGLHTLLIGVPVLPGR